MIYVLTAISIIALCGCSLTGNEYDLTIWEEADECGFRISGIEHQSAANPARGCFRWDGERCNAHYGDDCDEIMTE